MKYDNIVFAPHSREQITKNIFAKFYEKPVLTIGTLGRKLPFLMLALADEFQMVEVLASVVSEDNISYRLVLTFNQVDGDDRLEIAEANINLNSIIGRGGHRINSVLKNSLTNSKLVTTAGVYQILSKYDKYSYINAYNNNEAIPFKHSSNSEGIDHFVMITMVAKLPLTFMENIRKIFFKNIIPAAHSIDLCSYKDSVFSITKTNTDREYYQLFS